MSEGDGEDAEPGNSAAEPARPSIFLSYAAQDRPAAKSLRDALSACGVDVWYDESELGGGEAWDQKIRRQIRDCSYFMPVISAQTESRLEGYFRREWRLAVERTLDMADDHLFLLPVVIDDTDQGVARVPEKFLSVQWLKVPGGEATPGLEALCRRIKSGEVAAKVPARRPALPRSAGTTLSTLEYPVFPAPDPHQKTRFTFAVIGWAARSLWVWYKRLPRWIRIIAVTWLVLMLLSRGCSRSHHAEEAAALSPATAEKLKNIAQQYQGSSNKADVAKLGARISHEIAGDDDNVPSQEMPLLAIPFVAPAGDVAADKLADSAFAMVYGHLAVSRKGRVSLSEEAPSGELAAALEQGAAHHSTYVLFGRIEASTTGQVLAIKVASIADHSLVWSKSYPVEGSDPTAIATEVDARTPSLED